MTNEATLRCTRCDGIMEAGYLQDRSWFYGFFLASSLIGLAIFFIAAEPGSKAILAVCVIFAMQGTALGISAGVAKAPHWKSKKQGLWNLTVDALLCTQCGSVELVADRDSLQAALAHEQEAGVPVDPNIKVPRSPI